MNIFRNSNIGNNNVFQCVTNGTNNTVTINGQTFQGGNVSIINGKVIIDGKEQSDVSGCQTVNVVVNGNVSKGLTCSGNATINGNVIGYVDAGNGVDVSGDVEGDIDAGNSVTVHGSCNGDIDAGNYVKVGSRG